MPRNLRLFIRFSGMGDSAVFVYKSLLKGSKEDLNLLFRIASLYEQDERNIKKHLNIVNSIEKGGGYYKRSVH